jgi:hypothetical protein
MGAPARSPHAPTVGRSTYMPPVRCSRSARRSRSWCNCSDFQREYHSDGYSGRITADAATKTALSGNIGSSSGSASHQYIQSPYNLAPAIVARMTAGRVGLGRVVLRITFWMASLRGRPRGIRAVPSLAPAVSQFSAARPERKEPRRRPRSPALRPRWLGQCRHPTRHI